MPQPFGGLTLLEILLLVFVKSGLGTPYDLLSQIGLGVGGSSPALKRLQNRGLLTSESGPRNRMDFGLTDAGEQELKRALDLSPKQTWRYGRRDTFDNLRRTVFLAWVSGRPEDAEEHVERANQDLQLLIENSERAAEASRQAVNRLKTEVKANNNLEDNGLMIAKVYTWIVATMDAAQFKLQREALREVQALIKELPPAPFIWPEEDLRKPSLARLVRSTRVRS